MRSPAPIPVGKIPPALLAELLAGFDQPPGEVVLGPAPGEDACAISLGGGTLVIATDPVTLTSSDVGRLAVLVNANDVAVTGVRPRWFLAAVLLPPGSTVDHFRELFASLHEALSEIGAVLVGGHSEITAAVNQPVVVGQMAGYSPDGRIVATGGGRAGDVLVQIGPAPVEGAAVISTGGDPRLSMLPAETLRLAAGALADPGISVVEAALAAAELGATSMHDPTEGGLAGGLNEMALACGLAAEIDTARLIWFEPGLAVCQAVGADPMATLASGCVLAAFPAGSVGAAVAELRRLGYETAEIGQLLEGADVRDLEGRPIPLPERDEVARLAGGQPILDP
jgi:hydrogenase expression/formation protein HypE